jgi:predicted small lipoprotein YifL
MSASSDDRIRRSAALATAAALLLAGCGQTGPLYLPERGEVVVRPAAEPASLQTVLGQTVLEKDGAAPLTIDHPVRGPSFREL